MSRLILSVVGCGEEVESPRFAALDLTPEYAAKIRARIEKFRADVAKDDDLFFVDYSTAGHVTFFNSDDLDLDDVECEGIKELDDTFVIPEYDESSFDQPRISSCVTLVLDQDVFFFRGSFKHSSSYFETCTIPASYVGLE